MFDLRYEGNIKLKSVLEANPDGTISKGEDKERAKLLNDSAEMMAISKRDLAIAVESKNINVNYIARAYMTLSDIYLIEDELQKADKAIKKALRANKKINGVRERLKNINRLKLQ